MQIAGYTVTPKSIADAMLARLIARIESGEVEKEELIEWLRWLWSERRHKPAAKTSRQRLERSQAKRAQAK